MPKSNLLHDKRIWYHYLYATRTAQTICAEDDLPSIKHKTAFIALHNVQCCDHTLTGHLHRHCYCQSIICAMGTRPTGAPPLFCSRPHPGGRGRRRPACHHRAWQQVTSRHIAIYSSPVIMFSTLLLFHFSLLQTRG